MILLCNKSGQAFKLDSPLGCFGDYGRKSPVAFEHPIFSFSDEALLNLYESRFCASLLTANETRLLCLAMLNAIGSCEKSEFNLVSFEVPVIADYNLKLAIKAIPKLANLITIINQIDYIRIKQNFVSLRISIHNNDCTFLESICEEWSANYQEFKQSYWHKEKISTTIDRYELLRQSYAKAYKHPDKYQVHLSEYIISLISSNPVCWNIRVFNIAGNKKKIINSDYFKYIIQYSGNIENAQYIYPINSSDINQLLELIMAEHDCDNIFIMTAIEQLNKMLSIGAYNKFGANYLNIDVSQAGITAKNAAIADWTIENPEPLRANYPDSLSYFIAKNEWILVKSNISVSSSN